MADQEAPKAGGGPAVLSATIGYIFGGLTCFLGLILLFAPGPSKAAALVAMVPGIIVLPPVTKFLRRHMAFMRPTAGPPLVAFGVWVALAVVVAPLIGGGSQEAPAKRTVAPATTSEPSDRPAVVAEVNKLIAEGTAASTTKAIATLNGEFSASELNRDPELKPLMDRAKAAFSQANLAERASGYATRLDTFWTEKLAEVPTTAPAEPAEVWNRIRVFEDVARELEDGTELKSSPVAASAMSKLRRALIAKQTESFPALRRGYGKVLGRAAWEQDVEIIVQGEGGRTIRFIAGMFAANRNIASAQRTAQPNVEKLRFRRSQYEWYRGSESQYYRLETPADGAVGYWEGGRFVEVSN